MPEINPLDLIAECIEKCKGTTDREQIAHHISEALGLLQIENPEERRLQHARQRDYRGGPDGPGALRGSVGGLDRSRQTASDPIGPWCHNLGDHILIRPDHASAWQMLPLMAGRFGDRGTATHC